MYIYACLSSDIKYNFFYVIQRNYEVLMATGNNLFCIETSYYYTMILVMPHDES